ncbi:hypothetical protein CIHG_00298 [Coccidioides immitis H538.4]|uniref:Uncharacterized protein n=3 Tax=Coccidioides immitis TaxID=5501 RepID=A0A0J8QID6_COCIT|nr:hypothetical protein CIRG_07117 [Coccidioides immitis RMSCC 2394]KMU72109.1 hypothetical protein CISG_00418 [Coccidioides immitis RMSCC 3703]KMU82517.1 hypothetical protein CIHG_00298 [Coccidioides immitis H538.4]
MNVSAPESQDSTLANRNRCQNLPCYRKAWERASEYITLRNTSTILQGCVWSTEYSVQKYVLHLDAQRGGSVLFMAKGSFGRIFTWRVYPAKELSLLIKQYSMHYYMHVESMCAKGPLHPSYIHAPRAWQAFSATLWNVLGGFDDEPTSTRAYLINANAKSRRRLMQRALNYDW